MDEKQHLRWVPCHTLFPVSVMHGPQESFEYCFKNLLFQFKFIFSSQWNVAIMKSHKYFTLMLENQASFHASLYWASVYIFASMILFSTVEPVWPSFAFHLPKKTIERAELNSASAPFHIFFPSAFMTSSSSIATTYSIRKSSQGTELVPFLEKVCTMTSKDQQCFEEWRPSSIAMNVQSQPRCRDLWSSSSHSLSISLTKSCTDS